MRNFYHLFVALGVAAVSLSSCSRSNYAFNNSAPAYLGSAQVHAPIAAALTPEAAPTAATTDGTLQVAEVAPAKHSAHRAGTHAAAKAAIITSIATKKAVIAKIDRKAFKKELKRQLAAAPQGTAAEGKSQLVAAILCFFLGGLGVHDFYLGRVGKGILQIFLSLIAIGFILVIIDFIRILIGTEKPKNGDYAKKL
ncbi:TM2 domain-containing protein [Hymenobacter sp. BRD128]|uniref:TM2 domain-containing protein n=1 Tax=Hymenobacter sp. BRD128 TaxID=2675878 RepID=UPI0015654DD9|nr:TM2 domain-containing protein [Hymenobacter sp. BRD128]QKG57520.1 TM2 domain-containing protein [Hymenobacter sp. BRD128]